MSTNIPRLAREAIELSEAFRVEPTISTQDALESHARDNYGTLARYVEATAAIVEAVVERDRAWDACQACGDNVHMDVWMPMYAAWVKADEAFSDAVRAYRAKGKEQNQ